MESLWIIPAAIVYAGAFILYVMFHLSGRIAEEEKKRGSKPAVIKLKIIYGYLGFACILSLAIAIELTYAVAAATLIVTIMGLILDRDS